MGFQFPTTGLFCLPALEVGLESLWCFPGPGSFSSNLCGLFPVPVFAIRPEHPFPSSSGSGHEASASKDEVPKARQTRGSQRDGEAALRVARSCCWVPPPQPPAPRPTRIQSGVLSSGTGPAPAVRPALGAGSRSLERVECGEYMGAEGRVSGNLLTGQQFLDMLEGTRPRHPRASWL